MENALRNALGNSFCMVTYGDLQGFVYS